MAMKHVASWLAPAIAGVLAAFPALAAPAQLSVDAAVVTGEMRSLQGTASIPGPAPFPGLTAIPEASSMWHAAHVTRVRTWDWGARLDTRDNPTSLFPHWSADASNPASYNFAATDAWMKQTLAIGAQIQFTLGPDVPHNKLPPEDISKYQAVVEHIVRHYDQGWAHGFQHAIAYWEFSDQPDLGKLHYAGTPEQFYAQYKAIATAVKKVDPRLQVGGPGIAFPLNEDAPYREGFLAFVRDNRLPLDFFSAMWFADNSRDPTDFNVVGSTLRHLLDASGFKTTKLDLNTWNMNGIPTDVSEPVETAAFQTAAAIYMQDSVFDSAMLFRGDAGIDVFYHFTDPARMFVQDPFKDPRSAAFVMTGKTLAMGRRLKVVGSSTSGLAALAGETRSRDVVRILIVNHVIPPQYLKARLHDYYEFRIPQGPLRVIVRYTLPPLRLTDASLGQNAYDLTVTDLPWHNRASLMTRFRVDATHTGDAIATQTLYGATVHVAADLPANSIDLIEIRPGSRTSR